MQTEFSSVGYQLFFKKINYELKTMEQETANDSFKKNHVNTHVTNHVNTHVTNIKEKGRYKECWSLVS